MGAQKHRIANAGAIHVSWAAELFIAVYVGDIQELFSTPRYFSII
jgi:hypothetical protein